MKLLREIRWMLRRGRPVRGDSFRSAGLRYGRR